MCAGVEDELVDKFRHGGGVPYSSYPRFHETMAEMSGAIFDASLIEIDPAARAWSSSTSWRPVSTSAMWGPAAATRSTSWPKAFPNSRFVGYDFADQALERGRAEAAAWGLTNATFEVQDAAKLDGSVKFDFMTTFDAVHDQADPQAMVDGIYRSLKPESYWLCVDVQGSSYVGENLNHPMGTFLYSVSCQHCMTVSLAYDGVGLGAMWGVQKAREIFGNAGFDKIDIQVVPADPLNNYYICHRSA